MPGDRALRPSGKMLGFHLKNSSSLSGASQRLANDCQEIRELILLSSSEKK